MSKNNLEYKSDNNCILTKDGKTLVLCRNHNIPDGVTCIIGGAFSGYSSLESIVIPDGVNTIAECAFMGCTGLKSIVIPDSVTKIEGWAFDGCTSLQSIVIPDSVTEIEEWAFSDCTSLQSIVIPDGVKTIEYSVFSGCTSLESIVIPDSVIAIDEWAFRYCCSLQSITIVTQEKDPDLSREMIEHLLQALSEYPKEIYLKIPIGCEDAYRHHPAFKGKFVEIISDKQILKNAKKCVRKPNI